MNNFNYESYMYKDLMPVDETFNFTAISKPMGTTFELTSPYEGYMRGNMFENEYIPYKDFRPARLTPKNEQQELFLNLSQLAFAAHDINLLLDVHPDNKELINRFNEYRGKANEAMTIYEEKYGPLSLRSNTLNQVPWAWEDNTWPWEEGGME